MCASFRLFHVFSLSQTFCLLPNSHFFHLVWANAHFHIGACVTVTQGPCNVSPWLRSKLSTLMFPFELLKTYPLYYVKWTATIFSIIFRSYSQWNCPILVV